MGIPDQTGKVIVVTGGNTGIGKQTALALVQAGATVAITSRTPAKGAAAVEEITASAGGKGAISLVTLDLASLASVRACADEILTRFDRLDVLINNAGALIGDSRTTDDGFELTIGANHLGPFLLTNLLLDRLKASGAGRIVNVASVAHRSAKQVDIELTGAYSPMNRYGGSKLANILHAKELSKRLAGTGVTAFSVHPGGVRSEFGGGDDTTGLLKLGVTLIKPFEISPKVGASASLHCATVPGLEARTGGYFQKKLLGNFGPVEEVQPTAAGRDAAAATALWAASEAALASVGG